MGFIKLKNLIDEWVEDKPLNNDELSYTQLYRWALDAAKDMSVVDTKKHKIVLLQLNNTKSELPSDFYSVISVAYRVKKDKKKEIYTEQVVEYTKKLHNGCSIKTRVECNRCNKLECGCDTKKEIIEVDVDKIWELSNPWYYNASKFAMPGDSNMLQAIGGSGGAYFKLMKYSTNDFFNLNNHIPNCLNIGCVSEYEYVIRDGYIETNINHPSEVLLAYYGNVVDEDGDLLVLDDVDASEFIMYSLDFRFYKMKAEKNIDNNTFSNYYRLQKDSDYNRNIAIGRFKSNVAIPSREKLKAELSKTFAQKKLSY
jgi:hypothetical protein